ncbi:hypothetical protein S7335_453 [Synechococcus sp. PCC 7335]|uniref:hypothetical protein n=1 Tax=Synechococcus sp. (strain ATCC 29403 / PCC 7335) TaxID=91464 RepID=UPI00017EBCD0|nr:hypothetical protein [Synechococcus sp. PCC 7335]EDX83273.1 hypothetical protein S7335_453 [Synechococcus sp. PCC 7335]
MKPFSVVLIAAASAIAGGVVGALLGGGIASGIAGFAGGTLGAEAGICQSAETARDQNLLTMEQSEQLIDQAAAQLQSRYGSSEPSAEFRIDDCQEVFTLLNETVVE